MHRNEASGYGVVDWPYLSAHVVRSGPFLHVDRVEALSIAPELPIDASQS